MPHGHEEVWPRGRQPLLGAAPCCISMPTHGLAELPEADWGARANRRAGGGGGLGGGARELARVDPAAAARIHVNDPQRIQRALEVIA